MNESTGEGAIASVPSPVLDPVVRRRRRNLWIETSIVLLIGVLPALWTSTEYALGWINYTQSPFLLHAATSLIRNVGVISLIFFIIWRSGDSPSLFGLRLFDAGKDLLGGMGLWYASRLANRLLWTILRTSLTHANYSYIAQQRPFFHLGPSGYAELVLLIVISFANGLAEELVMRAYLIPRFEELFGSTRTALILTTLLFAGYHSYQGLGRMIAVALVGLLFGLIFCRFRRLWPIAIAHAMQDMAAAIVFPTR